MSLPGISLAADELKCVAIDHLYEKQPNSYLLYKQVQEWGGVDISTQDEKFLINFINGATAILSNITANDFNVTFLTSDGEKFNFYCIIPEYGEISEADCREMSGFTAHYRELITLLGATLGLFIVWYCTARPNLP